LAKLFAHISLNQSTGCLSLNATDSCEGRFKRCQVVIPCNCYP